GDLLHDDGGRDEGAELIDAEIVRARQHGLETLRQPDAQSRRRPRRGAVDPPLGVGGRPYRGYIPAPMFHAFRPGPVERTAPHRARGGGLRAAGTTRRWFPWAAAGMLVLASAACSEEVPKPATCGPPGPAFDVRILAPQPRLPSDLTVTALYGAGEETYRLSSPGGRSEVLFCSPQTPHPEPAGAVPPAEGGGTGVDENEPEQL